MNVENGGVIKLVIRFSALKETYNPRKWISYCIHNSL